MLILKLIFIFTLTMLSLATVGLVCLFLKRIFSMAHDFKDELLEFRVALFIFLSGIVLGIGFAFVKKMQDDAAVRHRTISETYAQLIEK